MRRTLMDSYHKLGGDMVLPIINVSSAGYTSIITTQNLSGQVDAKKYLNDDSFELVYSSIEGSELLWPTVQTDRTDGGRSLMARLRVIADDQYGVFVYKVTHAYGSFYIGLYKDYEYNAKSKLSNAGVHNTVAGPVFITHPSFTTG